MTRLRHGSNELSATCLYFLSRFLPAVRAWSGTSEFLHRASLQPHLGGHRWKPQSGWEGGRCPHQAEHATLLWPGYLPEYALWVISNSYGVIPKGILIFLGFLGIAEFSPLKRLPEFNELNSRNHKKSLRVFLWQPVTIYFCFVWKKKSLCSHRSGDGGSTLA